MNERRGASVEYINPFQAAVRNPSGELIAVFQGKRSYRKALGFAETWSAGYFAGLPK